MKQSPKKPEFKNQVDHVCSTPVFTELKLSKQAECKGHIDIRVAIHADAEGWFPYSVSCIPHSEHAPGSILGINVSRTNKNPNQSDIQHL